MFIRFLLCMLAICYLSGCDRQADSQPASLHVVKAITVESAPLLQNRHFPARILASDLTELSFKRNGVVNFALPREGVRVRKGDIVATLADTEARLFLHKRESANDLAQRQYARYAELARRHLISQADLDLHRQRRDTALAALNLAKEEMNDLVLKAPFDGVIAKINVKPHTLVSSGQPVIALNRTDTLDVIFSVPESVIKTIDLNTLHHPFQVELNALPGKTFAAFYKEHAANSDQGTLSWQMTLSLPRPEGWSDTGGFSGSVRLPADSIKRDARRSTIHIPASALFSPAAGSDGDAQAWVIKSGDSGVFVEPRRVTLGQMTGAGVEIKAGLSAGESIVVTGVASLTPHQQVKLWQREPGL